MVSRSLDRLACSTSSIASLFLKGIGGGSSSAWCFSQSWALGIGTACSRRGSLSAGCIWGIVDIVALATFRRGGWLESDSARRGGSCCDMKLKRWRFGRMAFELALKPCRLI